MASKKTDFTIHLYFYILIVTFFTIAKQIILLNRIRYRVLLVVAISVLIGLLATGMFYMHHQEKALLEQNERTTQKLTDSITGGIQSVMLAGSADIAQAYADQLKQVTGVIGLRIMRTNGLEAFRDNETIEDVNRRRGEETFFPRDDETKVPILPADDPILQKAINTQASVSHYVTSENGDRSLIFVAPVLNIDPCFKCHGKTEPVRGVISLTTSLVHVERDIYETRVKSVFALTMALMFTVLFTGYLLGRTIVRPIERVTMAMARVSNGDLNERIPVVGHDEISRMASSFNCMINELKLTYQNLQYEQDKLSTVIISAHEGMVVTNTEGTIVLTNPSAEQLLKKSKEQIVRDGFLALFGNRRFMESCIATGNPDEITLGDKVLQVTASQIKTPNQTITGSVAMIRDITEEKRLEKELRRQSTTDALTGLFNRRFLDATLSTEFQRAERTGNPLSVVMFDIDRFKKFNDTYGHDQGDRVLQMTAKCLRDSCQDFDYPCRYGGEEYVAILPGTNAENALIFSEALRILIANTEVDGLHVTISLGVSTFPGLPLSKPEQLIEAADAALYLSKENGRNQTTVAVKPKADKA